MHASEAFLLYFAMCAYSFYIWYLSFFFKDAFHLGDDLFPHSHVTVFNNSHLTVESSDTLNNDFKKHCRSPGIENLSIIFGNAGGYTTHSNFKYFEPINYMYCCPLSELGFKLGLCVGKYLRRYQEDLEGCREWSCDWREEPVHEVQLQHRGCHGDEHGLQRCTERAGLPPGWLPWYGCHQHIRFSYVIVS